MSMLQVTIGLLATIVATGHSVPVMFYDCGKGEIESIKIDPCNRLPCHFGQGQQANLTITFTPKDAAKQVELRSSLRTGGFFEYEIQLNDADPKICRGGNSAHEWGKIDCPVAPGKRYTFVANRKFPVSTSYNIFRYSKLKLINEYGKTIGCADWLLEFERYERPPIDDDE